MIDINIETAQDIVNSMNTINLFAKICDNSKISLKSLNISKSKKSYLFGDNLLTQYVVSDIISKQVKVINKCDIDDGEFIFVKLEELSENTGDDLFLDYFDYYLSSLTEDERIKAEIADSGHLAFLKNIGMKYIEISVPFAKSYTYETITFMNYIPYLLNEHLKLESCIFIESKVDIDENIGCISVGIYYIHSEECDFTDGICTASFMEDLNAFIESEVEYRESQLNFK